MAKKAENPAGAAEAAAADKVAGAARSAEDGAAGLAAAGREAAADAVGGLASVARDMAEKLGEEGHSAGGQVARLARGTAERLDSFSATLRDKDFRHLADDARSVVRDSPALAVGAAAMIGFALARFMKGGGDET